MSCVAWPARRLGARSRRGTVNAEGNAIMMLYVISPDGSSRRVARRPDRAKPRRAVSGMTPGEAVPLVLAVLVLLIGVFFGR